MLRIARILVTTHLLAGGAAMLVACGQKGPLRLPDAPESRDRATLPQTLNPWRQSPLAVPAAPAAMPSASEPSR